MLIGGVLLLFFGFIFGFLIVIFLILVLLVGCGGYMFSCK